MELVSRVEVLTELETVLVKVIWLVKVACTVVVAGDVNWIVVV